MEKIKEIDCNQDLYADILNQPLFNKLPNIENREFKTRIKNVLQNDYGKTEEIADAVSDQFLELKSNYIKSIFKEKFSKNSDM